MSKEAPVHFVPIELERDYPMLCKWWSGHKANPPAKIILPRGWVAAGSGLPIAACFLYVAEGKIAVIEYMTTNPQVAHSRELWITVCALYDYLEKVAKDEGCQAIISFVKPNSSEQRIMVRMGYATSDDDPGHKLYGKPLQNQEKWTPPADGVIKCPSPS